MHKLLYLLSGIAFSLNIVAADFEVFKSPNCGCCQKWVDALKAQGHQITVHNTDDLHKIKIQAGLPKELAACHTAYVDGYVIEGHVPIQAIDELLEQKPDIKGIAVPGMPGESLGMEQGREPQPYIVYGFKNTKSVAPLSEYTGTEKTN